MRQRDALAHAREAVARALAALARHDAPELVAVDVQDALERLGEVTGAITNDDVLDRVFAKFCLGK